ncbi:hypothetical protein HWV62_21671 [Athelia sp. TMB]|nr:hypothetical protein HWV62_21671 [Athelia sp. TMB]
MASNQSSNRSRSISECSNAGRFVLMKCLERFEAIIFEPGDGMSELRELGIFYEIEENIKTTKKSLDWLNDERENGHEAYVSFYSLWQFCPETEAAARVMIDQWLLSLLKLCSGPKLSLMVGVVPEMVISRSSSQAVIVKSRDRYTRLTGSTDYAIFSLAKKTIDMTGMHHYDAIRKAVAAAPVLFMEAKKESANMEECVRQVVAQSVAG